MRESREVDVWDLGSSASDWQFEATRTMRRTSRWFLQAVISRASFRRLPRNGNFFFYYDVDTNQQPVCQEAWHRKESQN